MLIRLTSFFLLLFTSPLAAEKAVHLFILSGQSNMAGMKPALGLVPEAKRLFPDQEVVFFKVAQGGKPIRLWVKEWNQIAAKHQVNVLNELQGGKDPSMTFYRPILAQYKSILEKHPEPASVTFFWMQGERDAREKLSAAYGDALLQLIRNLRRDLQQPEMNFVIGRLSDYGTPDNSHWQNVRATQVAIAGADGRGAWVDCDDLNNKVKDGVSRNDLHYTAKGYELLGRRFVRQARALVDGEQPAGNGRPE
tara:strand:- start:63 stop:815 length:753 start_codon:yes stop_codon:yes gene_type:complete